MVDVKENESKPEKPTEGDLMLIIFGLCELLNIHGERKFKIDLPKLQRLSKKRKLMIEANGEGIVEVWTPQKPKDRKRILTLNKKIFTGPN